MKTTLNIDDSVMARLKRKAARTGRTICELVEIALRNLLQSRREREPLPPLPSFNGGGAWVDIHRDDIPHDLLLAVLRQRAAQLNATEQQPFFDDTSQEPT